jgi:iron complex outermembrane recepter protein
MSDKSYRSRLALWSLLAALVLALGASGLQAQTKQLLSWQEDLASLQNATGDELLGQRAGVAQIRDAVEFWLKYHPSSKVELKAAPPQPWSAEELKNQVSILRQAVEGILKEDPNRPFNLGITTVSVSVEASALSLVTDSLSGSEIANRQILNFSSVFDAMPGVSVDQPTGSRNEAYGRIRGFSTRGQVPFYLDGIPQYVPYDGYVDMNRFLTSDIAEIQVSKGYASPLMGPNGLAGSINLVTRQPEKKFEANGLIGTGSGKQLLSSLGLGSRWDHFYVQGSFDWLQRDFIPLSGNYSLNKLQKNYERNDSASRDEKWSGRIAYTPKGNDQYSFSFVNQKGKKDGLQYIGPGGATYTQFWTWPYWNKNGYYLITNTGIGESSSIKLRGFYDQFRNSLYIWDDATHSTMAKSGSEQSKYNDYTDGISAEFSTRLLPRNTIGASLSFEDDTHRSTDLYPGVAPYPKIYPQQRLRDQQVSIGFQDMIKLTSRLRVTIGFSADHMKGLFVSGYNSTNTQLIPLTCLSSPQNSSFSGCAAHVWTYNPQASVSYNLTKSDTLFVTFSDRARFPLLKDSYSYRFNRAWPNPELGPEHSRNWNIGYSRAFARRALLQIEYFHADLRDAIQSIYVADTTNKCPGNTGTLKGYCSIAYNAGKEAHQGAEISIRTSPMARLTFDASYSYLNRTIAWDYTKIPEASQLNLATLSLPSMYKNKFVGNATVEFPHQILGLATFRYEGGIRLQDTYISTQAYGGSFGVVDIGTVAPVKAGFKLQAGIKNLFDRDYHYTAGYP